MKKIILLLVFIFISPMIYTSAQTELWETYSGSDGETQTLLSGSNFKALKIEIKRTTGGSFDVELQVVSEKQTYTESFLSASEEFVITASSIILIFTGNASGQFKITFYDSYPDALLSSTSSNFAFGILFGGAIFLTLILSVGYISWRSN